MQSMLQKMLRKTVNLTGSTAGALGPFLETDSDERRTLEELIDDKLGSENDVLRALLQLGIRAVKDRQLEMGYAALAAARDNEDEQWARATQKATKKRWRDEPD